MQEYKLENEKPITNIGKLVETGDYYDAIVEIGSRIITLLNDCGSGEIEQYQTIDLSFNQLISRLLEKLESEFSNGNLEKEQVKYYKNCLELIFDYKNKIVYFLLDKEIETDESIKIKELVVAMYRRLNALSSK